MSGNVNPTPSQILAALRDHGVDVSAYKNWDTIGRAWKGPDGSPGLMGAVVHHTATASATGSKGAPSLYWAVTAYDRPVCNLLVGRGPGDTYLLSAGSAYHCGDGVTPAFLGSQRGFFGQSRLWGIEIDDPGRGETITDYQVQNTARTLAALADLCGWDVDQAVGTHKCYTDGCHGWQPKANPTVAQGGTRGRKNDTIDGAWAEWPGDSQPDLYNAPFWRAETAKYLDRPETWDKTIPSRAAALRGIEQNLNNRAVWRVACRLYDLEFRREAPLPLGEQRWPMVAYKKFQRDQKLEQTGRPDSQTWVRLFGKDKP
jgi:hypothetical protein